MTLKHCCKILKEFFKVLYKASDLIFPSAFLFISPAQLKILYALATIRTRTLVEIDLSQHGRHEKMCALLVCQVGQCTWYGICYMAYGIW